MKEWAEKIIYLGTGDAAENIARQVEEVAEAMHKQGWYFTESFTDELMENLTLFFERDIDI